MVDPIARPRNRVAMLIISFWADLFKRSTTPLSRNKFPNINVAINGAASGASRLTMIVTTMGKMTLMRW